MTAVTMHYNLSNIENISVGNLTKSSINYEYFTSE